MPIIKVERSKLFACPSCGHKWCYKHTGRIMEVYRLGSNWYGSKFKHVCTRKAVVTEPMYSTRPTQPEGDANA